MRLDEPEAITCITALLGTSARRADYSTEAIAAYEREVNNDEVMTTVKLIIWPLLSRVDVRLGDCTWLLKRITDVELYPGVEVLFRRDDPPAYLLVSTKGRIALVT